MSVPPRGDWPKVDKSLAMGDWSPLTPSANEKLSITRQNGVGKYFLGEKHFLFAVQSDHGDQTVVRIEGSQLQSLSRQICRIKRGRKPYAPPLANMNDVRFLQMDLRQLHHGQRQRKQVFG